MNKKFSLKSVLLYVVVAVVCDAILLVLFNATFSSITGRALPWWAYIVATCIYALIGYLVYLLIQIRGQRFDRMLVREGFHADKCYEAVGQKLYIDFQNKRIANTYLSTKPLINFSEVVGYRVECFQTGSKIILSEDERYLNLVLTINKEDPTPEHPYLYLAMFEVKVAAADVPETPDVTEELVTKYPELQPLYELKQDVLKILEDNKTDSSQSAE